jgi:acyl-CoA thioesterase I
MSAVRFAVILLFLSVALFPPTYAAAKTILIVGDSLSAAYGLPTDVGWVTLLQKRLEAQKKGYRVINASISGDTTMHGLARLEPVLKRYHPDIVIIELGGNDGLRGYPHETIKANLEVMIHKIRASGAKPLLVGVPLPPNYGSQYIEKFLKLYRETAIKHGVPLVGSLLTGVGGLPALMQADGIHPNSRAQPILLENVWLVLKDEL